MVKNTKYSYNKDGSIKDTLYDTDPEEWHRRFDATYFEEEEPNYTLINLFVAILGITLILFYHFY